ncbi:MAG: hypothetical protein ACTSPW_09515 [Promethearchaeota archaeon]
MSLLRFIENKEDKWTILALIFNTIKETLLEMLNSPNFRANRKVIEKLITRLNPIFDINLFSENTEIRFDDIIKKITIINFSQLPTE